MTAKCYDCLDSVKALSLNFLTLLRSSVEFLHFWLFHLFRIGYIYPLLHLSNRQTVWFVSVLYRTTNSRFIFRISCSVHNEIHFSIQNSCNKFCYKYIQRFIQISFHLKHISDLNQYLSIWNFFKVHKQLSILSI